tara:strand:- start:534 stop:818 length:285 start_codon:yes stop_codon:yes gene_type:complete
MMGSETAAATIEARARGRTDTAARGDAPASRAAGAAGAARHGARATVGISLETALISITRGGEWRRPRIARSNREIRAYATWTVAWGCVLSTVR